MSKFVRLAYLSDLAQPVKKLTPMEMHYQGGCSLGMG